MSGLRITRPLVVFDLETTGVDIGRDRIVEIGVVRLDPDGGRDEWVQRINPDMPIPPGATAVHGITDADVRDMPRLADVAAHLLALFAGADAAGFNSASFDLPFLAADLERVGQTLDRSSLRHVDAMRIFHLREPRDLSAALRFYCGREHAGAHTALADARATLDILEAQVARYDDLPADIEGLHAFCGQGRGDGVDPDGRLVWSPEGEAVFTFGKYKGRTLRQVAAEDAGYLRFLQKPDLEKPFSAEVRRLAREAAAGRFPVRPTIPAEPGPAKPAPGKMAPPPAPEKGQGSLFS
jgi:DNA polymerase III subunit epsilon